MKRFILFLVLITTQVNTFANISVVLTSDDGNNLVVAQGRDGKYGYKKVGEDKFVIKPKFLSAKPFSKGIAIVSVDNKKYPLFGMIDTKGKYIIKPKYKTFKDFVNGLAKIETDNGWGLVSEYGIELLPPEYKTVEGFVDGLARIESNNGWGLVNTIGEIILPPNYITVEDFKDGLARVKTFDGWGLIDKSGRIIVDPIYFAVDDFIDGFAKVETESGDFGLVSKQGEFIVKPSFWSVDFNSNTQLWECIDEEHYLLLLNTKGEQLLGTNEQLYLRNKVGRVLIASDEEGQDHLLSCLGVELAGNGKGYVNDLGCYEVVEIYGNPKDPKSSSLLVKKEEGWGLISGRGLIKYEGFPSVDTSLAPKYLVFNFKEGGKSLYDVSDNYMVGGVGSYNDFWKGYSNDWVLIGESNYCIDNGTYRLEEDSVKGVSIEMVDDPNGKSGSYLIRRRPNKPDKLVLSYKNEFHSGNVFEKKYIEAIWKKLTPDLKNFFIDEGRVSPSMMLQFPYKAIGERTLEIRSEGNIYTYESPYSFQCSKKENDFDGIFYFYKKEGNSYVYYTVNEKSSRVVNCFHDIEFKNLAFFGPDYMLDLDENTFIIAYHAYYNGERLFQYAPYQYVMVQDQLWQVNGPSYTQTYSKQGFLSLLDKNSLSTTKTVALEGIKVPYFWLIDNDVFCWATYAGDEYREDGAAGYVKGSSKKPIYILDKQLTVKYKLLFEEGVDIFDCWSDSNYIYLCGSDTKHGYVGFRNPIFLVIDKNSHKVVKTIREEEKGVYYSSVTKVDKYRLLLKKTKETSYGNLENVEDKYIYISSL